MKDLRKTIQETLFRNGNQDVDSDYINIPIDNYELASIQGKTLNLRCVQKEKYNSDRIFLSKINDLVAKYPKYDLFFEDAIHILCDIKQVDVKNIKIKSKQSITILVELTDKIDLNGMQLSAHDINYEVYVGYRCVTNFSMIADTVILGVEFHMDYIKEQKELFDSVDIKANTIEYKRRLSADKDEEDFQLLKNNDFPEFFKKFNFNTLIYEFSGGNPRAGRDLHGDTRRVFVFSKNQFDNNVLKYVSQKSKKLPNGYYFIKKANNHYLHYADRIIKSLVGN